MLTAENIEKSFGQLKVLRSVSLSIDKGEIVSITGASGAGKSTLLHILGTLEDADVGNISINNNSLVDLKNDEISAFRNKYLGFVFQFHHLLPEFNAIENVCMPGFIAKRDKRELETHAKELLTELGLEKRFTHKPSELSGGEQQRVAIARALINRPQLIMADEPSGNLDSEKSKELHELFFQLREKFNQTFVIVTHNMQLAEMADRQIVMKDGEIIKGCFCSS